MFPLLFAGVGCFGGVDPWIWEGRDLAIHLFGLGYGLLCDGSDCQLCVGDRVLQSFRRFGVDSSLLQCFAVRPSLLCHFGVDPSFLELYMSCFGSLQS